jgi:hypothetical protein
LRGFSATHAAVWSLSWALGVALGVALGAYLSVIGSAAAPGAETLGSTDLLVLPVLCGLAVFAASFFGRLIVAFVRRTPPRDAYEQRGHGDDKEDDDVGSVE